MEMPRETLEWLLEEQDPGVRYLALKDLVRLESDSPELEQARLAAHQQGPVAAVCQHLQPPGYWKKPGAGYSPKYFSSVWALILLAQLGARAEVDARIGQAGRYLLDHALTRGGLFSYNGTPSGTFDCLQGNLCWALTQLGIQDERLELAYDWLARSVTGEGVAPIADRQAERRYYVYKCGPGFVCGANDKLPCGWGAVKVALALGQVPPERQPPQHGAAVQAARDFLLSVDPATAAYPTHADRPPNLSWWKFGFPVFYITDLLQLVEALNGLGCSRDPRLEGARAVIASKADAQGRYALEYDYAGKTWVSFGPKRQPNKWVTLRAWRVLQG